MPIVDGEFVPPVLIPKTAIGVALGVAGLDAQGDVVDASGNKVVGSDVSTLTENTLYVSATTGDDTTGARGTVKAYETIGAAIADAVAGDIVRVAAGNYTETNLYKNGVTLDLAKNAVVSADLSNGLTEGLVESPVSASGHVFVVTGQGTLKNERPAGGSVSRDVFECNGGATIRVEAFEIISTNGRALAANVGELVAVADRILGNDAVADSSGVGGNITATARLLEADDDGHILECDGGVVTARANKISSTNNNGTPVIEAQSGNVFAYIDEIVFDGVDEDMIIVADGTATLSGTVIDAPDARLHAVASADSTVINLIGVTPASGTTLSTSIIVPGGVINRTATTDEVATVQTAATNAQSTATAAAATAAAVVTALDGKAPATNIQESALSTEVQNKLNAAGTTFRVAHGFNTNLTRPFTSGTGYGDWLGFVDPANADDIDNVFLKKPEAPTGLALTAGDTEITLTLDPYLDSEGTEATSGCVILVKVDSDPDIELPYSTFKGNGYEYTITGLTNTTEYDVSVAIRVPVVATAPDYTSALRTSDYSAIVSEIPVAASTVDLSTGLLGFHGFEGETVGAGGPFTQDQGSGLVLTADANNVVNTTNPLQGTKSIRNTTTDGLILTSNVFTPNDQTIARVLIRMDSDGFAGSAREYAIHAYQDRNDLPGNQTPLFRLRGKFTTPGDTTTFAIERVSFRMNAGGDQTYSDITVPYDVANKTIAVILIIDTSVENAQTFRTIIATAGETTIDETATRTSTGINASNPCNQILFRGYGRTDGDSATALDGTAVYTGRTYDADFINALTDPTLVAADFA